VGLVLDAATGNAIPGADGRPRALYSRDLESNVRGEEEDAPGAR
jgi:hypothetical protein